MWNDKLGGRWNVAKLVNILNDNKYGDCVSTYTHNKFAEDKKFKKDYNSWMTI